MLGSAIILSILFIPLISFLYQLFFASKDCHKVSIFLIGANLGLSLFLFIKFLKTEGFGASFEWINISNFFYIHLGFWIDSVAIIMILVVSLVSFLVHLYSISYMKGDSRYSRYFAYLGFFTFSMNGVVIADNLFMIFIFWELVGLSSYLLIGFWYEKKSASLASKKAFLMNRIGDIGMFLGIMILFVFGGNTFNIIELHHTSHSEMSHSCLTLAGILIFFGAIGKSAQIPLQTWLPDAMEGPTPVSALIHAATMVAAGVYMLVRVFPIMTQEALFFIAIIGSFTALTAGFIAITQNDIKKVLAYSTVSQLGYMVLAIGMGNYVAAMYHLITHAMFKACLFLGSGSVIHAMHHASDSEEEPIDPQDMRNMGGLKKKMPITYITMLIATLSICGFPFFSGFLSKDEIINASLSFYHLIGGMSIIFPVIAFITALITAFYMFRMIFLTFWGEPSNKKIINKVHESDSLIKIPLIILATLSFSLVFNFNGIFNPEGWLFHSISIYEDSGYHQESIELYHSVHSEMKLNHTTVSILSVLLGVSGALLAYFLYIRRKDLLEKIYNKMTYLKIYQLSLNKFYFDRDYIQFIYKPFKRLTQKISYLDWEVYDKKVINFLGPFTLKISKRAGYVDYTFLDQMIVDGFANITNFIGKRLKGIQSGVIQKYLLVAIIGIIALIMIIQQF